MATITSTTNVSSLVINKVDTKTTFQNMLTNNQVNENELYFIPSTFEEDNEIFKIEFTNNEESISCNKTYSEILEAINNGSLIYTSLKVIVDDNNELYTTNFLYNIIYSQLPGSEDLVASLHFYSPIVIFGENFPQQYLEIIVTNSSITTTQHTVAAQNSNSTLTIGSYTYNGSQNVNIPVYDGTYTWG